MAGENDITFDEIEVTGALHTLEMRRPQPGRRFTLPTLRVVAGPDMLRFTSIYPNERVTIGREPSCDLILTHGSVSRRHAAVTADVEGNLLLEDLGSTNGTCHNGGKLDGPVRIVVGDHVDIGSVTLRVDRLGLEELGHLARVVERLDLASKDPLTGLGTRLFLDEELPTLVHRHQVGEVPLAAVFLDIDHFKQVNDTWGHQTGDEVLRAVARLLVLTVRDSDTAVRYGGEELLAVLRACDEVGAVVTAERIRRAIEGHDWSHYADGLRVTASLGVALLEPSETVEAWIERADKALYAAKRRGRNRVVPFSDL